MSILTPSAQNINYFPWELLRDVNFPPKKLPQLVDPTDSVPSLLDNARKCRSSQKSLYLLVIDLYKKAGLKAEAVKMKLCMDHLMALVCDNNHTPRWRPIHRCHLPLCPSCSKYKAYAKVKNAFPKIADILAKHPQIVPVFITLTVKDRLLEGCTQKEVRKKLQQWLRNFRQTKEWKFYIEGAVHSIEVSFNTKTRRWHPHVHMVALRHLGNFWKKDDLEEVWNRVATEGRWTKDEQVIGGYVDIRKVDRKNVHAAIKETLKYPNKLPKLEELAEYGAKELLEIKACKGVKSSQQSGLLYGYKVKPFDLWKFTQLEDQRPEYGDGCTVCGQLLVWCRVNDAELMKLGHVVQEQGP